MQFSTISASVNRPGYNSDDEYDNKHLIKLGLMISKVASLVISMSLIFLECPKVLLFTIPVAIVLSYADNRNNGKMEEIESLRNKIYNSSQV